jgi:hypothetical protein
MLVGQLEPVVLIGAGGRSGRKYERGTTGEVGVQGLLALAQAVLVGSWVLVDIYQWKVVVVRLVNRCLPCSGGSCKYDDCGCV